VVNKSIVGELPPFSEEAEQGLVGCSLINPACADEMREAGFQVEWLYHLPHRTLFEAIRVVVESGSAVDMITVSQQLRDSNSLEAVGGLSYLSTCMDAVPSASNWPYYLAIVREKFIRRSILSACIDISTMARSDSVEPDHILAKAEAVIDGCRVAEPEMACSENKAVMRVFMEELQARAETALKNNGLTGIPTGFRSLDAKTCGLQSGELVIIAARPKVGKTAIGLNIATHAAYAEKVPTIFLTAEMSKSALMGRVVSTWARIDGHLIRSAQVANDERYGAERERMMTFSRTHMKCPMYWEDVRMRRDVDQIASIVRGYVRKHGVRLVVVDYAQLLNSSRGDSRAYELSDVMETLKNVAVRCKVAMVVLAQINRDSDKGTDPRMPKLSELKDSGGLEQAGECIMLLHRDPDKDPRKAVLKIAKMRDGAEGIQPLEYIAEHFKFVETSRIEAAE